MVTTLPNEIVVTCADAGDGGTDVRIRINPDEPSMTLLDENGNERATVIADWCNGRFQFLLYGAEQLRGADGYVSVRINNNGNIRSVEVADFTGSIPNISIN